MSVVVQDRVANATFCCCLSETRHYKKRQRQRTTDQSITDRKMDNAFCPQCSIFGSIILLISLVYQIFLHLLKHQLFVIEFKYQFMMNNHWILNNLILIQLLLLIIIVFTTKWYNLIQYCNYNFNTSIIVLFLFDIAILAFKFALLIKINQIHIVLLMKMDM